MRSALNLTGNAVDDPDQTFYENYACKSERNYTEYCNPEMKKLFDGQSAETDREKRRKWCGTSTSKLQNDVRARSSCTSRRHLLAAAGARVHPDAEQRL